MKTTFPKTFTRKEKILSMVLVLTILISLFPVSNLFAWTAPSAVTINKSANAAYFTNKWGTSLQSGLYYVANTGELAYCADQSATGPGGTPYTLNDAALRSDYFAAIQAAIQNGYPFNKGTLTDDEARYATQIVIHWLENYYLGGGNGYDYSIRGETTTIPDHQDALQFALDLFNVSVSGVVATPTVTLEMPSPWTNVGGVLQCTVPVTQVNTQGWNLIAWPAGVAPVNGKTAYSGDTSVVLQLTDLAAYAASDKKIAIQGYCNYDTANIHVFTAGGGYQTMVAVSTAVAYRDPEFKTLADASGEFRIHKVTQLHNGTQSPEAGAEFQVYSVNPEALVATVTTDANGDASVSNLPLGTYNVHQTIAPPGTFPMEDQIITLSGDPITYGNFVNDATFVQITKTDTDTGHVVPGARITIYQGASVIATRTTGSDGKANFEGIPAGSYTWKETAAPAGYKLNPNTYPFTVNADGTVSGTTSFTDTGWGMLQIHKAVMMDDGSTPNENGAGFLIYKNTYNSYEEAVASGNSETYDEITTDHNGIAKTWHLEIGTYVIHQVSSANPGILYMADALVKVTVPGATITYEARNETTTVTLLKTDSQTGAAVSGATITVYDPTGTALRTAVTNATGRVSFEMLPVGSYTWKETAAPDGYALNPNTYSFTINADGTLAAGSVTTMSDEKSGGKIEVNKTTDRSGVSVPEPGALFEVYLTSAGSYAASPADARDQLTAGANGYAVSKTLPYGNYSVRQITAPMGTVLNTSVWTADVGTNSTGTIVAGDMDTVNVVNASTYGKLEISKTTNRGYGIPEAGAAFEVYSAAYASYAVAPATEKDTITTFEAGTAITKDLPYGIYRVHQSAIPSGTKAVADFTVTIGETDGETVYRDLINETFWGDIQILKYKVAPSDSSGTQIPEPGATFRIYPSSFANWEDALVALTPAQQAVLMDEITSDMGGVAKTKHQLPYGEYTVEQIDTIANLYTFKVDAWKVFIGETDDQTYTYVRNNEIYEQYLAVIKTDAETGQVIRMAGATFRLLAEDGKTLLADTNGVSDFVTDANGRIDIKDLPLQVGNYFIQETKAPMGYTLNSDLKSFAVSITDHGSSIVTIDYGRDIRSVLFTDTAQTCRLTVEKMGDVLTSAAQIDAVHEETGTRYLDEAGTALSIYDFSYSLAGKAGAVFEVFVGAKDICDNNGLIKKFDKDGDGVKETSLAAGTSLGTIITAAVLQKDGTTKYIASLAGLPLDAVSGTAQYIVKEITAPVGDLLNPKALTYDFTNADQTITQIDQEQSMTDARQKVQITVQKQKEAGVWNKDTKSFDWPKVGAQDILFGIYTTWDIKDAAGTTLVPAGSLVDVMLTNVNGSASSGADLPLGLYYAKELNGTEDVIIDKDTTYPLAATASSDQTQAVVTVHTNQGQAILNREIAGVLEIYKLAADTELPMPGVVFEVYDKDANLVDALTTDVSGKATTRVLPFGKYTLVETKTLTGYKLSDPSTFSIYLTPKAGETFSTLKMTISNQKLGEIEVYKVTADGTSTPMNGVVFGVFDAKTDAELSRMTTDMNGYAAVYVIPGSYYLKEISTWDGYSILKDKIMIEDAKYAQVYTFRLTNSFSELRVCKESLSGVPLAGMEFTISTEDGKTVPVVYDEQSHSYIAAGMYEQTKGATEAVPTTGDNGEVIILGLLDGTYVISETKAPDGYRMDASPKAAVITEISSGKEAAVVTLIDSPVTMKTGETGDNEIVLDVLAIGCLCTSVTFVILRKIKRRSSDSSLEFPED